MICGLEIQEGIPYKPDEIPCCHFVRDFVYGRAVYHKVHADECPKNIHKNIQIDPWISTATLSEQLAGIRREIADLRKFVMALKADRT